MQKRRSATAIFIIKDAIPHLVSGIGRMPCFFTQAQNQHDACPGIEPIQDFQMSRFLGQWYSIQDTAVNGKCITYNYRQVQEPGKYVMLVTEYITIDTEISLNNDSFKYPLQTYPSGVIYDLTVSEPSTLGRMDTDYFIRVPPFGGFRVKNVSHVVFITDYDTYAGVFKYLPNIYGHKATILSRTKTLDQMHVDKIRQKLSQCSFDLSNLEIIEQSDCPEQNFSVTVPYNDTAGITI